MATAPPIQDVTTESEPQSVTQKSLEAQADTKGLDIKSPDPETFVSIKTTLPIFPLPAGTTRGTITTPRLFLRVLTQDDLQALHT